jgi:hypothetical protein
MKPMVACILIVAGLWADSACAQLGMPWRHVPKITVVGAAGDEAVAFWNRGLAEIGSGFRLGSIVHLAQPVPEEELQVLSTQVLGTGGRSANIPAVLRDLPGDITIVLANSTFVSFTSPRSAKIRSGSWESAEQGSRR